MNITRYRLLQFLLFFTTPLIFASLSLISFLLKNEVLAVIFLIMTGILSIAIILTLVIEMFCLREPLPETF